MRYVFNVLALLLFYHVAPSSAIILPRASNETTYHQGTTTSSGAGRGRSGDTGKPAIPWYNLKSSDREANFFGGGGGLRFKLPKTSIFKGREVGGGLRSEVLGTRSYGSGYPYTSSDIRTYGVVGQPFPFGFWPLYWFGWGNSNEYGKLPTVEWQRPGDSQVYVKLAPSPRSSWGNATLGVNKTLWMIGDRQSITGLLSVLVDPHETYTYGCGVQDLNINVFDFFGPPDEFQFDNVIQWYRSSSFALAYDGYNNTHAVSPLNQTGSVDWNDSTPFPTTLASSPFLQCINNTILSGLPIIDQDPPRPLGAGTIAGIVVAGLTVIFALLCITRFWIRRKARKNVLKEAAFQIVEPVEPMVQAPTPAMTAEKPSTATPNFRFPEPFYASDEKPTVAEKDTPIAFPEPELSPYTITNSSVGAGGDSQPTSASMDSVHPLTERPRNEQGQDSKSGTPTKVFYIQDMY